MIPRSDFTGEPIDLHQVRRQARVTDTALITYLAHVVGRSIDQICDEMLSDTVLQAMAMDATSVRGDGFKFVIDNFTLVTTLPPSSLAAITPARRRRVEG